MKIPVKMIKEEECYVLNGCKKNFEMCMKAVKKLIEYSDIIENNIIWWEVSKNKAVFYTPEEIEKEGLT